MYVNWHISRKATKHIHGSSMRREVVRSPREFMSFFKSLAIQKNWQTSLEVLDSMRSQRAIPDIWVYNTVLHCCSRAEAAQVASDVWHEMISSNLSPDIVSYNSYMTALAKGGYPARALKVFDELTLCDVAPDIISMNIAMSSCGKLGKWERALALFSSIDSPTPASYTTVLAAVDRWQQAFSLYESFPQTVRRSVHNLVLRSLASDSQFDRSIKLLEDIGPSTRGYNTTIHGATWEQALDVLTVKMPQSRCAPDATTYSATMRVFRIGRKWERALEMLGTLTRGGSTLRPQALTVVAYNEVLRALEQANKPSLARNLLHQMGQDGCMPNVVSYQSAIVAVGRQQDGWKAACDLFEEMVKRQCSPDPSVCTALFRILGEGGQWRRALDAFDTVKATLRPTIPMFNACISALHHGQSQKDALRLLHEARNAGNPDIITYTAAITACTDWCTALKLFNSLRTEGVKPTIKTASAIIRALAREQPSIALRIFAKIAPKERDSTLLNTALLALDTLGAWSEIVKLVTEHAPACDGATYRTAIDICERQAQFAASEDLFKTMVFHGFQTAPCGLKLDLHGYTQGMACAAVRSYLRVEPIRDIIIVTGEGKHSIDGPVLAEALIRMGSRMRPAIQLEVGSFADLEVLQAKPLRGRMKLSGEMWARWIDGGQLIE